jgi:hypothetical protein
VRLLPSDGEPDEFYLRRVSSLRRGQGVGTDVLGSLPSLDPQVRGKRAVEEIKTFILHNLDLLADSFISLGEQFLAAAEDADPERLEALAAQGTPVNAQDCWTASSPALPSRVSTPRMFTIISMRESGRASC